MHTVIEIFSYGILGYLCGSLSFALWMTRLLKGVDVRESGSGHATATNTMRTAGWGAFVVVLVLDLSKGFFPVWLALNNSDEGWIIAVAATCVVIGHCWPLFAGFKGGMGLAAAGGALLAIFPPAFFVGLGVLIVLMLLLQHSARAAVITGPMLPIIFGAFGWRGDLILAAAGVGVVIALRFLSDWNRQYKELWLDRQ